MVTSLALASVFCFVFSKTCLAADTYRVSKKNFIILEMKSSVGKDSSVSSVERIFPKFRAVPKSTR